MSAALAESQPHLEQRQHGFTAAAETYLALLNIERAIDFFLGDGAVFVDGRTRLFLARLRDAAGSTAAKLKAQSEQSVPGS